MPEQRARLRRSLRNFKRLLALEPGHIGHLEQLARVCAQLKRPKDAARYLTERAGQLMRMGETGAAREDVSNALRLYPRYRVAQRLLAKLGEQVSQPRARVAPQPFLEHPPSPRPGPIDRDPTPPPTTSLRELEAEALLAAPPVTRQEPETNPVVDASELLAVREDLVLEDDLEVEPDDSEDQRPTTALAPVRDESDTLAAVALPEESMEEAARVPEPAYAPTSFELGTADLDEAVAYESIEDPVFVDDASPTDPVHLGTAGPTPVPSGEALKAVVARPLELSPTDGLPERVVDALRETAEQRRYEAGERIAVAAARFDGLRLIDSGRVLITLPRQASEADIASRGSGDLLGVVELVRGGRWSQHVTAVGPTCVLHLDPDEVLRVREKYPAWEATLQALARHRFAHGLLGGSKLFASLTVEQRDDLAQRFESRHLSERETLIEPGVQPEGVYLLAEGRLEVKRDDVHIGGLSPGDCVGLVSALDDAPGEAKVVAAPVAEVLFLPHASLEPVLAQSDVRAAFERAAQMRRLLVSRR